MRACNVLVLSVGFLIASRLVSTGSPWGLSPYMQLDPYPHDQQRPPIAVPEGCDKLLSRGCGVTSSTPPLSGELSLITDGVTKCRLQWGWGMQHLEACVTLSPGLQWVQVDLGEEKEIHAVCIWHCHLEHSNQRAYRAVICRISSDPDFADGAVTVFNNDYENSAGFGKGKDKEYVESPYGRPFATGAVKGRYVRCYSNGCFDGGTGNDQSVLPGNHYTEIEVYGRGGKGEKHDQ